MKINPSSEKLIKYLTGLKSGSYEMFFLKNVFNGNIELDFSNGLNLQIDYSPEMFPTIGIWWNNYGYPDQEGLRRCECAFEPIPGSNSNLSDCFKEGHYLKTESGETRGWEINWTIQQF